MKNKNQPQQLDLFTPFVEIFHEVCMLLFDLVKSLVILGYQKAFDIKPPLKKLEMDLLKVKKSTDIEDALGIDANSKKPLLLNEIDFRRHSFIVGASGFGKTNLISILQENSLRANRPIIFFDPKGDSEALNTFKSICEKYKRPCYIFSEHYENSISLNPLLEGTVNQVTDRIMRAFVWSDPFYQDQARSSLLDVLERLKKDEVPFTLTDILNELGKIKSDKNLGLHTKLKAIQSSDFGRILNAKNDGFTLSKIRKQNACLYIGLSTQGYGETAIAIGKLFLGELLYNSYKTLSNSSDPTAGLKNPISIYFDEFGSIAIPEFIELQNKCRGAGMELTVAVQTASDINKVDPELTKQIIENAGNLFILKQRLDDSAALFSNAIGTIISKKETNVIEDGQVQSRGTVRTTNELLAHPDLIKNLNIGQCVLLRQGPVRLSLVNIRNRRFDHVKKSTRKEEVIPEIISVK